MLHKTILISLMLLVASSSRAQLSPGRPEQDPCGALELQGTLFSTPQSYTGFGAVQDFGGNAFCQTEEVNSVWLRVYIWRSGLLNFVISPADTANDYDFTVFNITGTSCGSASAGNVVRCSGAYGPSTGTAGKTGLEGSGSLNTVPGGSTTAYVAPLSVVAGETYLIEISNFSYGNVLSGFSCDFSASTAGLTAPSQSRYSLYVAPGGVLSAGPGSVIAVHGGDVLLDESVSGTGTLKMNGTAAQYINARNHAVPELDIDNSQDVFLDSSVTVNTKLTFASGLLYLGVSNLTLGAGATATANASSYAVTNGTGTVTRQGIANGASFTFPIGQAAGDYTPASVLNLDAATRDFTAQVKTYADSAPIEGDTASGVNRTFQIYSSAAGQANIGLTTNTVGSTFNAANAFVTQQTATNVWSIGTAQPGGGSPVNTIGGTFNVPASPAVTSYFSKSSNGQTSLGLRLLLNPVALLQGAWNGSAMTNTLNTRGLIPLAQPYSAAPFNYAGTESVSAIPANVTDWVLVDLRTLDPGTGVTALVSTRAAFVTTSGAIVGTDGSSPVAFTGLTAGTYVVGIRHRNHLAVQSALPQGLSYEKAESYDFSTAQAGAYQNPGVAGNNAAMAAVSGGRFALWAGNANGNNTVRVNGLIGVNDYTRILTNSLGGNPSNQANNVYTGDDVNLNGSVRVTGLISLNDYSFLLTNALGGDPTFTLTQHSR